MSAEPSTNSRAQERDSAAAPRSQSIEDRLRSNYSTTQVGAEARADRIRVVSRRKLTERMTNAGEPTSDDVTILADGTRLDTQAKIDAYVEELTRRSEVQRGDQG